MSFLVLVERASGLRSADFMGKSDPYVNLVCGSAKYQTGIIDNNNNPVWDEMFLIHTQPGAEKLDFVLFDSDAGTIVDGSDDFLGQCSLDLRQVANNTNWTSGKGNLTGKKAKGSLHFKVRPFHDNFTVTIAKAVGLKNADGMFGKSDPYAVLRGLTKMPPDMRAPKVFGTTTRIKNDLNPVWNESFVVSLFSGAGFRGGKLAPLCVACYDHDDGFTDSTDDLLGEAAVPWETLFPADGRTAAANLTLSGVRGAKGYVEVHVKGATSQCAAIGEAGRAMLTGALGAPGAVAATRVTAATVTGVGAAPPPPPAYYAQPPPPPVAYPGWDPGLAALGQQPPARVVYAPPQPQMMTITVPPGGNGQTLIVQAPNGQQLQVTVPPGYMPGMQFQVQIP